MKNINKKFKLSDLEEYKTTLILFSILLAVMSLVIFIPLKNEKITTNTRTVSNAK